MTTAREHGDERTCNTCSRCKVLGFDPRKDFMTISYYCDETDEHTSPWKHCSAWKRGNPWSRARAEHDLAVKMGHR